MEKFIDTLGEIVLSQNHMIAYGRGLTENSITAEPIMKDWNNISFTAFDVTYAFESQ